MVNPKRYFIVVTKAAVFSSGLSEGEIRLRLCAMRGPGEPVADWVKGQETTIEDDGRVRWTVTRSKNRAPDGKKLLAFVVKAERYAEESKRLQDRKAASRFDGGWGRRLNAM